MLIYRQIVPSVQLFKSKKIKAERSMRGKELRQRILSSSRKLQAGLRNDITVKRFGDAIKIL
jgi:hypothetical protein